MLTTPLQVKSEGNLPGSIDDGILDTHITKAAIDVKKIITAEKYEEIENLDHNDENYIACSIAEANLALAYAIPALNMETQGNGIVKTKGWDQSRSDLLNQDEINMVQERYRNVAMDLLKPYIPQIEPVDEQSADEVRGADYRLSAL